MAPRAQVRGCIDPSRPSLLTPSRPIRRREEPVMAKQRVRRSRFRLLISLLAAAVTLGVGARTLALIPGGHGAKTDCYSEFDIAGVTSTAPTKIQCMDGDPCDQDHMCNDTCTFKIRLCINNQNAVTGCTPPRVAGEGAVRTARACRARVPPPPAPARAGPHRSSPS